MFLSSGGSCRYVSDVRYGEPRLKLTIAPKGLHIGVSSRIDLYQV
jgi:hypothetical protein